MKMDTYVVDASVGVKWFFNEEFSDLSRKFFHLFKENKIRIVVPDFFYVELANNFRHRIQKREIKTLIALQEYNTLINFRLERYSDHELVDVSLENAIRLGVSVYDALYISLAEIYAAPLITADEVLIKACKNKFDFVLSLKDFGKN